MADRIRSGMRFTIFALMTTNFEGTLIEFAIQTENGLGCLQSV